MKKNIFLLAPMLFLGGAETQFRNLIINLDPKRYDVTVFTLGKSIEDQSFRSSYPHIKYRAIGKKFNSAYNNSFLKLINLIFNYFIVYIKLTGHFMSGKRYNVAISYGTIMFPFIPLLKIFNDKLIFSERTATNKLSKRKYLKYFYRIPDIVTCNSPITEGILKDDLSLKNVKMILNGIDLSKKLESEPINNSGNVKIITILARIHPVKNQLTIVKAMKKLTNKKLILVGKIVDLQYYNEIISYIKNNNLEGRVFFEDFTKNTAEVYYKSDVIVLPSLEEGLSNVLLESFYFKRYCIASNIPTNAFLLKNNRGGLFEAKNQIEFISVLSEFENISNEDKEIIIEENYHYVNDKFSIAELIRNYESLF